MTGGGTVTVVGSTNLDLVTSIKKLPVPGETVLATGYAELAGGKGSNQAIAAARMGSQVSFVGRTGRDGAATMMRDILSGEGIDLTACGAGPEPTGRAIVMVEAAGENSIIVVPGANAAFRPQHAAEAGPIISDADVVVSQLEIPLESVLAAAKAAKKTFILNPAPAQQLPGELLELVDVLVVNEVEYAEVFGTELVPDETMLARDLARPGLPKTVVITLGGEGAAVWHDGKLTRIPAPKVTVVDTTGAGDTFVGALASEIARGSELLAAARVAVTAASLSTRQLGATTGMPRRGEVLAQLPTG